MTSRTRRRCSGRSCPLDRDTDVLPLYVDPDAAVLDADKYEVGGNQAAKELNAAAIRQSTSTGATHPPRPDRSPRTRAAGRAGGSARPSAPTSTRSRPATGAAGPSSPTSASRVALTGSGATVTVYRSMANGRSQRVDSATTERRRPRASSPSTCRLKPFVDGGWYWYDVVAGDEDVVVESAEWTAEVPDDRAAARHRRHRDHHDEPARLLRQAARPDRRRPRPAPVPRRGARHGAGHPEGGRLRVLPEAAGGARRHAPGASSRATSAAPAATPAASSSRSARAPRRTR